MGSANTYILVDYGKQPSRVSLERNSAVRKRIFTKKSMRTYCNDDRKDENLKDDETQEYLYTSENPGKVIQVFMQ